MILDKITRIIRILVWNKNYSILNKARGGSYDSNPNYSSPNINTKLSFNNEYMHNMNDFDNQNLIPNLQQRSSYTLNTRPGRFNGFMGNYKASSVNQSAEFLDNLDNVNNEYDQNQSQNRFDMRSSNLKRFEHNLLLPVKNPRELTKLLSIDKNKFAEIFRNKHKLDKMKFRINRNTPSILTTSVNIENGDNLQTIEHQSNDLLDDIGKYSKNSTSKLEKLMPAMK